MEEKNWFTNIPSLVKMVVDVCVLLSVWGQVSQEAVHQTCKKLPHLSMMRSKRITQKIAQNILD
jgi:hypothetical protein